MKLEKQTILESKHQTLEQQNQAMIDAIIMSAHQGDLQYLNEEPVPLEEKTVQFDDTELNEITNLLAIPPTNTTPIAEPVLSTRYIGMEHATPELRHASRRTVTRALRRTEESSSNRWTEREDIFLTGIVLDFYYRRHSLKANAIEKQDAKQNRQSLETLVWTYIHKRYEVACGRYYRMTNEETSKRSAGALQKRWKSSNNSQSVTQQNLLSMPISKRHERIWDAIYNANYLLTCEEGTFNRWFEGPRLFIPEAPISNRFSKKLKPGPEVLSFRHS